uniref:Uncharacterized protein n=1 Tax=Eptatretus burgeri TaxID=7764 RepID=A0A8C4QGV8_EPTBU
VKPSNVICIFQQLCQPIRLLLEHVGEKYEDKFYVRGDGPDYDRSCWLNEKFTLGLAFPNVSRFYHAYDLRIKFCTICFSPDFVSKLRQGYVDALPGEMKQLAAFLGKGKWFAGDKVSCLFHCLWNNFHPPACERPHLTNSGHFVHRTDNPVVTFWNNARNQSRVGFQSHHNLVRTLPALQGPIAKSSIYLSIRAGRLPRDCTSTGPLGNEPLKQLASFWDNRAGYNHAVPLDPITLPAI